MRKYKPSPKLLLLLSISLILVFYPVLLNYNLYALHIMILLFLYMTLSLSWNLLILTGYPCLGQGAFVGISAYVSIFLAGSVGVPIILAIILSTLIAALSACLIGIPLLRLKGPYFAIGTMAFAEILRILAIEAKGFTGGVKGIYAPLLGQTLFPLIGMIPFDSKIVHYYIALVILVIGATMTYIVFYSRFGLFLFAIREDEESAKSIGINVFSVMILCLGITGFLAGLAGAFYAYYVGYIVPGMVFGFNFSFLPLIWVLFGGIQTYWGPFIGTAILFLMDELFARPNFPTTYQFIYGGILVVTVLFIPEGIYGRLVKK